MTSAAVMLLIALFFATSVIGVVTGSNSLITVPVMFQFGIPENKAVATNMFGLVFMAAGGSIPFLRRRAVDLRSVSPLVVLTIVSSAIGAAIVGLLANSSIKLIVSAAMIVVALLTVIQRRDRIADAEQTAERPRSRGRVIAGYLLTFILGIYGGLYSGGYVTVLTIVFVAFLYMSFAEAVAATKVVNVFSSSVATIVFMWQGLVDYGLGIALGVTMFVGAYVGAHYASRMGDELLRRIFLVTVLALAGKTIYDAFS